MTSTVLYHILFTLVLDVSNFVRPPAACRRLPPRVSPRAAACCRMPYIACPACSLHYASCGGMAARGCQARELARGGPWRRQCLTPTRAFGHVIVVRTRVLARKARAPGLVTPIPSSSAPGQLYAFCRPACRSPLSTHHPPRYKR